MPKSSEPSEADIIFNRASLALAKSQRLIESWLPPKSAADIKTEEQLEAEEREIFTVVPERLGLGAPLPKDGETLSNKPNASNEKLRKQLLGKDYKKIALPHQQHGPPASIKDTHTQSRSRSKPAQMAAANNPSEDEDDENEGRSSLGRRKLAVAERSIHKGEAGADIFTNAGSGPANGQKKRRGNYLDEVLSERSKKRNKKKFVT